MGHKIPYLSSLLVKWHQSSRLYGVIYSEPAHEGLVLVYLLHRPSAMAHTSQLKPARAYYTQYMNSEVKIVSDQKLDLKFHWASECACSKTTTEMRDVALSDGLGQTQK